MDMEHRRQRHVDVVTAQRLMVGLSRHRGELRQRVENDLPVAEGHRLGQPGGPRGVEGRRERIFVEIDKAEEVGSRRQQCLVVAGDRHILHRRAVVHRDLAGKRRQPPSIARTSVAKSAWNSSNRAPVSAIV